MKLWLDDVRKPPRGWKWAKTYEQAVAILETGEVEAISFDHDLGEGKTGYDVAVWVEERAVAGQIERLWWKVHSQNPIGKLRIQAAMKSAERFWK